MSVTIRASLWFCLGVATAALVVSVPSATSQTPPPPETPPGVEAPPRSDTERLQELYRSLYELQLRLGRQNDASGTLDSLRAYRQELLEEIEEASERVARERGRRLGGDVPAPPRPRSGDDISVLVEELGALGEDFDWEGLSSVLEGNTQSIGEGLALLGEQLRGLQVDVGPERVRIENDSGSRFTFTVPEEVRQDLSEGIREMGRELNRVLADSSRDEYRRNFEVILDELPEGLGGALSGWRPKRERKVIAESVFRTGRDFEVRDDELVRGDVIILGADAYVAGEVEGNVVVLFGDLFVEGRARVVKDAVSVGGAVEVEEGSEVLGKRLDLGSVMPGLGTAGLDASGWVAWMLQGAKVAMLALLLFLGFALVGERLEVMSHLAIADPGRQLLSGSIWLLAVLGCFLVAAVGLVVSVIGIPVVIVLTGALFLAGLLAYFVGCQALATRLLGLFGVEASLREWQVALLGLAVLEIPASLSLAFAPTDAAVTILRALDLLLKFLVLALGFGVALHTRFGRRGPEEPVTGPAELPAVRGV